MVNGKPSWSSPLSFIITYSVFLIQHYHLPFTIYDSPFLIRLTKKTFSTYIENPLAGRSSNGRTADSESAYRGSNPCLPAKHLQCVRAAACNLKQYFAAAATYCFQ